jgi:hypothetical protein
VLVALQQHIAFQRIGAQFGAKLTLRAVAVFRMRVAVIGGVGAF